MPDIKEKIVPSQSEGGQKNIENKITAIDINDARKLFVIARNRLLDVNRWHELVGGLSAKFMLTDPKGKEVHRTAEVGDYFKIDLPGPGSSEGKGFDWVHIEAIEDKSDSTGPYESTAMRVRPSGNPTSTGENVAHFFSDSATSTFVVERKEMEVAAFVFGRNEIPNTETTNVVDKMRNAVVGSTAIAGISNLQWSSLVKGLLRTD